MTILLTIIGSLLLIAFTIAVWVGKMVHDNQLKMRYENKTLYVDSKL